MPGMTMDEQNEMLRRAEDEISAVLTQGHSRESRELIDSVKRKGIDEYFVRAALLFLLDAGQVFLDDNYRFRLRVKATV